MKEYISEIIGDEFKTWKLNQVVFISAPTGSGKTRFVLDKLIEYAALNGRRILYLVNRKILKEQIEKKIDIEIKSKLRRNRNILEIHLNNVIKVEMYQSIEDKCKNNPVYRENENSEYQYIIADECHYFFSDSTFNTYTQLSYDWIMKKKRNVNIVFISATIDRIKEWVLQDNNLKCNSSSEMSGDIIGARGGTEMEVALSESDFIKEYDAERDYSCVKFNVLEKNEELVSLVQKDEGKWLIFVDSIKKGQDIQELFEKEKIESIFIDAKSREHEDILETLRDIVQKEYFSKKVLVTTSVMDNGISINDIELRNMIIMADTEEEFIQMLGRKRYFSDNEELEVYVIRKEMGDFKNRLADTEQCLKFISEFSKYDSEKKAGVILEKILMSDVWYRCAKSTCFVKDDILTLNAFASEQYSYLQEYYQNLIERFKKEGGYAFTRQQAEWLRYENTDEVINNSKDKLVAEINNILDDHINEELSQELNEEIREKIRGKLKSLLSTTSGSEEKDIIEMGKPSKGRPFSEERFNRIMKCLHIEYTMKKTDNGKMITQVQNL